MVGWPAMLAGGAAATPTVYGSGLAAHASSAPAAPPGTLGTLAPPPPTGLTATAGDSQVTLSWSPPAPYNGPSIIGYDVYMGTSPGNESPSPVNGFSLVRGTSYTMTGLTDGVTYYFTVAAVDKTQTTGTSSAEASATPQSSRLPPPTGLTATAGDSRVTLSWSPPASGGPPVTGYDVYMGTSPGHESASPVNGTSPGWLGYSDTRLAHLARKALADGFGQIKLKVGADLENDRRRLRIAREAVGPEIRVAVDANQQWDVAEAIEWIRALAPYDLWWVEEPTSPDDVLGHASVRRAVAPIRIATGEHVHNRVMFKQLLQAQAIDVLQLDAVRVGGVNENIAILLLAAKFGVPVCPHAGGVGLCELVQHLAMFDLLAVSGTTQNRAIEYVDHLHEHFVNPVVIHSGRYTAPRTPGFSAQMRPASIRRYTYPTGAAWAGAKRTRERGVSPLLVRPK